MNLQEIMKQSFGLDWFLTNSLGKQPCCFACVIEWYVNALISIVGKKVIKLHAWWTRTDLRD